MPCKKYWKEKTIFNIYYYYDMWNFNMNIIVFFFNIKCYDHIDIYIYDILISIKEWMGNTRNVSFCNLSLKKRQKKNKEIIQPIFV